MLNKLQFQNLAELQLQNLDQPLCSKSEKSLVSGPNVSSQICNKLLPKWSPASTSASLLNVTESVSESVSQWVSYWQALPMIGLRSDKNKNHLQPTRSFLTAILMDKQQGLAQAPFPFGCAENGDGQINKPTILYNVYAPYMSFLILIVLNQLSRFELN